MNALISTMNLEIGRLAQPLYYSSLDQAVDSGVIRHYGSDCEYLWILRQGGTHLFPLQKGWPTYMATGPAAVAVQIYHIKAGELYAVSAEEAWELVTKPPELPQEPGDIVKKVTDVLSGTRWGHYLEPKFSREEPEAWKHWKRYFKRRGNRVMVNFLEQAESVVMAA